MKTNKHMKYLGMISITIPTLAIAQENNARPNIIVVLADDMGYSDIGCYGGEIETPNLDSLATTGLRWKQFYNNARSCPSRAVLMTGLYPHQAGMGWMAAADLQTPAYQGYLNQNCVTIAEVLKSSGYATYMCGKWHLSSDRQNNGSVIKAWPKQRGFDRFYGIPSGASNYFNTTMYNDNTPSKTDTGFYITEALSDSAATFISRHDYNDKPLFLYLAYNAPHWPLHAPENIIRKYISRYKSGWDKLREERLQRQKDIGIFNKETMLSPRDSAIMAWDSLTPEKQEEFARRMAIYAAQVDILDSGIGKVVDALKKRGQFDNTIIMFMSDNGACAEFISSGKSKAVDGSENTYESYRINWANLSSTPYREYKHYTNEGGIASPLIVSWPNGINEDLKGKFIDEYGYFADIMATCVDVSKSKYPKIFNGNKIHSMEGVSLLPNLSGKGTGRKMTFWEHEANIAVRDGKWKLVLKTGEGNQFKPENIELYDMEADPVEMNDLSQKYPKRAEKMLSKWYKWAKRVEAFPLDTRFYGERQAAYKRVINGKFIDNFGGWGFKRQNNTSTTFSIDSTTMNGNCAKISILEKKENSDHSFMKWGFRADSTMIANIGFRYKVDNENTVTFCLENTANPSEVAFKKTLKLSKTGGEYKFDKTVIPHKGQWQLIFHFITVP